MASQSSYSFVVAENATDFGAATLFRTGGAGGRGGGGLFGRLPLLPVATMLPGRLAVPSGYRIEPNECKFTVFFCGEGSRILCVRAINGRSDCDASVMADVVVLGDEVSLRSPDDMGDEILILFSESLSREGLIFGAAAEIRSSFLRNEAIR